MSEYVFFSIGGFFVVLGFVYGAVYYVFFDEKEKLDLDRVAEFAFDVFFIGLLWPLSLLYIFSSLFVRLLKAARKKRIRHNKIKQIKSKPTILDSAGGLSKSSPQKPIPPRPRPKRKSKGEWPTKRVGDTDVLIFTGKIERQKENE